MIYGSAAAKPSQAPCLWSHGPGDGHIWRGFLPFLRRCGFSCGASTNWHPALPPLTGFCLDQGSPEAPEIAERDWHSSFHNVKGLNSFENSLDYVFATSCVSEIIAR